MKFKLILGLIFLLGTPQAVLAQLNLYWVGTDAQHSGNWNDIHAWRVDPATPDLLVKQGVEWFDDGGAMKPIQAPRSDDNVMFDSRGISGDSLTIITVDQNSTCLDLTFDAALSSSLKPVITGQDVYSLQIYGSLSLVSDMYWYFDGDFVFASDQPGNTIFTANNVIRRNIRLDASGATASWTLLGNLQMDTTDYVKGKINLIQGTFNTNGYTVWANQLYSRSGNVNRKIILGSSEIHLYSNSVNSHFNPFENSQVALTLDFDVAGMLDAGTSHIYIWSYEAGILPGERNQTINFLTVANTRHDAVHNFFGTQNTFRTLELKSGAGIFQGLSSRIAIDSLVLYGNRTYRLGDFDTIRNIHIERTCDEYLTLMSRDGNTQMTVPADGATLNFDKVALQNLNFTNGTFLVGDWVDLGNVSGLGTASSSGRTLYWVGGASGNWADPTSWSETSGGLALPSDGISNNECIPTIVDDVIFDVNGNGGGSYTVRLTDSSLVYQCRNLTWVTTGPQAAPSGSQIQVTNTSLAIYGSVEFLEVGNITGNSSALFFFWGYNYTVRMNGAHFPGDVQFESLSHYTLLDEFRTQMDLKLFKAEVTAGAIDIHAQSLFPKYVSTMNFTGTNLYLFGNTNIWRGGNHEYNLNHANCTVYATATSGAITIGGSYSDPSYAVLLPNFVQVDSNVTLNTTSLDKNLRFEGNVTLNGDALFNGNSISQTNIDSLIITGNLILGSGQEYLFPGGSNKGVLIQGNLVAQAECTDGAVLIQAAQSLTVAVQVDGSVIVENALLRGLHAVANYSVSDSEDLGDNVNWTFINAINQARYFYWRPSGSAVYGNYSGNWNDPTHWAYDLDSLTAKAKTIGDGVCLPTSIDYVIFDDNSVSGADKSVFFNDVASCQHFITEYTTSFANVFKGTSNIIISGDLILDPLTTMLNGGEMSFTATDDDNRIQTNGVTIKNKINFDGDGGTWRLYSDFTTIKDVYLKKGTFHTQGHDFYVDRLLLNGTSSKALYLYDSEVHIDDGRNNGSSVNYSLDFRNNQNFTFSAGTSKIYLNNQDAAMYGGTETFNYLSFTDNSSSKALVRGGMTADSLLLTGNTIIEDDNTFEYMKFFPGMTYEIEAGSTQTFNSPNGMLDATGNGSNLILMQSATNTSTAYFHKSYGTPICFDFIQVRDIEVTRDPDNVTVEFVTGSNSDNILSTATGYWFFNRPTFVGATLDNGPDQNIVCPSAGVDLSFSFTGSGPFLIDVHDGTQTLEDYYAYGASTGTLRVFPSETTTYTTTLVQSYDCADLVTGIVLNGDQTVTFPPPKALATDSLFGTCEYTNYDAFFTLRDLVTELPIMAVNDRSDAFDTDSLGDVTARVLVESSVREVDDSYYMPRYFLVDAVNDGPARLRIYFQQSELDALSVATGKTITMPELLLKSYPTNALYDDTQEQIFPQIGFGSVPNTITTTPNVFYADFAVSETNKYFVPFVDLQNASLPTGYTQFACHLQRSGYVSVSWAISPSLDVSKFEVEKSQDGQGFELFKEVPFENNTNPNLNFEVLDTRPHLGSNYYRVWAMDAQENRIPTPVHEVYVTNEEEVNLVIYPNPSYEGIFHFYWEGSLNTVDFEVFNSQGLKIKDGTFDKNHRHRKVDLSKFSKGNYILKVRHGDFQKVIKLSYE